jgi:hypothetical protein
VGTGRRARVSARGSQSLSRPVGSAAPTAPRRGRVWGPLCLHGPGRAFCVSTPQQHSARASLSAWCAVPQIAALLLSNLSICFWSLSWCLTAPLTRLGAQIGLCGHGAPSGGGGRGRFDACHQRRSCAHWRHDPPLLGRGTTHAGPCLCPCVPVCVPRGQLCFGVGGLAGQAGGIIFSEASVKARVTLRPGKLGDLNLPNNLGAAFQVRPAPCGSCVCICIYMRVCARLSLSLCVCVCVCASLCVHGWAGGRTTVLTCGHVGVLASH